MTPHAKLRTEITDWLKSIGAWYVCTNSRGYGRKGIPDILACIRGKFVAIEVKVLPDKLKKWQHRELYGDGKKFIGVADAGGVPIVAYSLDDVKVKLSYVPEGLGQLTHDILNMHIDDPVIEPDGKGGYRRVARPFRKLYVPKSPT